MLDRNHHRHTRVVIMRFRDYMKALQSAYARRSVTRFTCNSQLQADEHKNTRRRQKQSDPPTCTDSFTLVSLDRVPSAPFRHVAEFLQWCARKFTSCVQSSISAMRTLPNTLSKLTLMLPTFRSALPNFTDLHPLPPPQRSRRNPKRSSAARLTRVSNCPRKAIAPTVRMERSGSGTYQPSPTLAACLLISVCLTGISRSGTCQA